MRDYDLLKKMDIIIGFTCNKKASVAPAVAHICQPDLSLLKADSIQRKNNKIFDWVLPGCIHPPELTMGAQIVVIRADQTTLALMPSENI